LEKSTVELQIDSAATAGGQAQGGLSRPQSALIDASHPRRKDVESFIAQRFLDVHAARINGFMPELLALFDNRGQVLAAVGIRAAGTQRLFLEYYLDNPVEQVIAECSGVLGERAGIVEIGNLASRDRRASRALFRILAKRLQHERFEWAVFTGCSALHRMFATLGIETITLGRALQARLPRDQQTWGGYYEDNPQVVAGRVNCARAVFEQPGAVA
jgi:hypothetical protein